MRKYVPAVRYHILREAPKYDILVEVLHYFNDLYFTSSELIICLYKFKFMLHLHVTANDLIVLKSY